jgi:hypothetical protein
MFPLFKAEAILSAWAQTLSQFHFLFFGDEIFLLFLEAVLP